jgi:hypothetical protein
MLANTVMDISTAVVSVKTASSSEFRLDCTSVTDFEAKKEE